MPIAVTFFQVALAIHIMAVVVGFGVTFTYPLIFTVGKRMDPRAMPWMHRMQVTIGRTIINPGLAVVVVFGLYLAGKLDAWSSFYVGWGIAVALVLGALGGMFFIPREKRLAELAERDIAAAGDGPVQLSDEYEALAGQVGKVGALSSLLILLTILFMTLQTGA